MSVRRPQCGGGNKDGNENSEAAGLLPQPDEEWVSVLAVDLDLGEQRKSNPISAVAEGRDLRF
jgi:hypothetical protein